jgi:taurine--2-oxoglutarate transaminase
MAGFGRCGEWFAVDRWKVAPDLITFAKGSNSGYIPVGGVIMGPKIAETYKERVFPGGLTYSGHPLACASIVASIGIFKEERIVEHARHLGNDIIGPELQKIAAKHPCVGEARGLGVFWALELVRDRKTREPFVPFNASGAAAKPMGELMAACKANGVWPFAHFNRLQITPPCTTSDEEVRQGLAAIDKALDVADKHCTG